MSRSIGFGVGCFAFEWRDHKGERNAIDWANSVKATLRTLEHVSSIYCEVPSERLGETVPDIDLRLAAAPHPDPVGARVEFAIRIPEGQQERDVNWGSVGENFHVTVGYGYYGPFAFVCPLDPIRQGSSSNAVVIVRKHLEKYFSSNDMKFSMVGPSPFHAEFSLSASDEDQVPLIECGITKVRGYDYIEFTYDPVYLAHDDAYVSLVHFLTDEISLYYFLTRAANKRAAQAGDIGERTQELISLHTHRGWGGRFKRLFRSGRSARELALAVMEAEYTASSDREVADEAMGGIYKGENGYLVEYVAGSIDAGISPLVSNARNVVAQLEGGRTKELEVTLLAGSTLTGALAGGVISALVNAGVGG